MFSTTIQLNVLVRDIKRWSPLADQRAVLCFCYSAAISDRCKITASGKSASTNMSPLAYIYVTEASWKGAACLPRHSAQLHIANVTTRYTAKSRQKVLFRIKAPLRIRLWLLSRLQSTMPRMLEAGTSTMGLCHWSVSTMPSSQRNW